MTDISDLSKRVLSVAELEEVRVKMASNHFLDNALFKDWTKFVVEAITKGVSDFDIDQFALSDEEFDKKYESE